METLLQLLPRIERLGSREALRFWNGYRTWRWSYLDLDAGIRRFVAYLDVHGIGPGDRLLLWSENRPEWVAVFWACLARGVQVVPLDHQSSPEFVNRIAIQTSARLLVHSGTAANSLSDLERFAIDSLSRLPPGPRFSPTPVTGNDVAEIIFTSGTTAEPKGVIHLHRNICANLEPIQQEINRYRNWTRPFQPIRVLDLLPLSHMFGQAMGIFFPLLLEGSAAFMTGLHPASIRQTVRREHISVLVCVPRILDTLRNEIERHYPRSRSTPAKPGGFLRCWWRHRDIHWDIGLRFSTFVVGGAALDPGTEAFWSRIGLLVIQGYGLTETSPVVSVNHPFRLRPGTLGEVIGGEEIRIADDNEILVRGDSVVREYLVTGNRRMQAVDADGWLHTGDVGELDAEGRLLYRGRKKDVIVTADGMNVYPSEIEAALKLEDAVRDAVIVPVGPAGAERIHAALILNSSSEDLLTTIKRVNHSLEPHQRIQGVSEWPEAEFPRTSSTLKTQRRKVAERLSSMAPPPGRSHGSGLDEILLSLTQRHREDLTDDRHLAEDLGLSSLERIDMLAALENHYGIEVDEMVFSSLSTVGEVRAWIEMVADSSGSDCPNESLGPRAIERESTAPRIPPTRWTRNWSVSTIRYATWRGIFLPLFHHYIPLEVVGLQHLERIAPPVVFAANHQSHLDTVTLIAALPAKWRRKLAPAIRQQHFFPAGGIPEMARRFRMRAFYYFCCGMFNAYPLSQEPGQIRDTLRYTGELVDAGFCPLLYPEGKLTEDGSIRPFKPGIGMMSLRLEVPVVPVYLTGMFDVMSRHDAWPRRGPVRVEFGSPIVFSEGDGYTRRSERIELSVRRMAARADK